jgi:hypothetical protein
MICPTTVDTLMRVEGAYLSGDGVLARVHFLEVQIDIENDGLDIFGILHKREAAGCYRIQKELNVCLVTDSGEILLTGSDIAIDFDGRVTIMSVPQTSTLLYSIEGDRVKKTLVLPL